MSSALRIIRPGLSTTIQDLGRPGYQRYGIPTSGALDSVSLQIANRLVGNPDTAGGLEFSYIGATFTIEAQSVRLAFVGGNASIRAFAGENDETGSPISLGQSFTLVRGEIVSIGSIRDCATLYMAVEGGFAIAPTLGSVSTFLRGGIGGLRGRKLEAGDILPLLNEHASRRGEYRVSGLKLASRREFRLLPGPQVTHFSSAAIVCLCSREFIIGAGSDRTGMRLEGAAIPHSRDFNIVSDAVVHGSIQIPGDGHPIVLLVDRQTTGGYPKIATIISADLPAVGRLPIGSRISFRMVDADEADEARRAMRAEISALKSSIIPISDGADLFARLWTDNLVSGVVDAYA